MSNDASHSDAAAPAKSGSAAGSAERRRPAWRTALIVAAVVFALGMLLHWVRGEPMERLTPERFREARRQWQRRGPGSYDLEVQVQGRQAAHYRVEVRNGQVVAAYHDGNRLKRRRILRTWSVPGMFDTIAVDVENLEKVADGNADASTPRLRLRTVIHPQWGIPMRYHRVEMVRKGSNPEASWKVTKFDPL